MANNYRAEWHDYTCRCIYMITLCKNPSVGDFGHLEGDISIPVGQWGSPFLKPSAIGVAIKRALRDFGTIEPKARVLQYALMPDHLHVILFIQEQTEDILGRIIARFKVHVGKLLNGTKVFDKGFNDQILKSSRSLDVLFGYLRDNPRRLAVRRAFPDFFRRVNGLRIGDSSYQAYGNIHLIDCPFKEQVVVHRADSAEQREEHRRQWLYTAANGGVLVSPFISPAEKAIRSEAEALGGRIILISSQGFGERYKPNAHDFALCETGKMLIVSAPAAEAEALTRAHCLEMNALACRVAEMT